MSGSLYTPQGGNPLYVLIAIAILSAQILRIAPRNLRESELWPYYCADSRERGCLRCAPCHGEQPRGDVQSDVGGIATFVECENGPDRRCWW